MNDCCRVSWHPPLTIAHWGEVSDAQCENSIIALLTATARSRSPFSQWDQSVWLAAINRQAGSRPYLTAVAYHLGGLRDLGAVGKLRHSSVYARAIFGREIFWREHARLAATLRALGYSSRHLELFLTSVLGHLMLENGDPRLETFSMDLLQKGQAGRNYAVARAVGKVSNGLAAMGIIETPLRMRSYVGWKDKNTKGVSPDWARWCARWRETSTLRPKTREANYGFVLRVGLWLTKEHPHITPPADWDVPTCAAFIAALDRMTVGQWLLDSAPQRALFRRRRLTIALFRNNSTEQ